MGKWELFSRRFRKLNEEKMIFMHETNAEVLEGLNFSQNWMNYIENYKYKYADSDG